MDALSDVLSVVRLTGAVFLEMELRAQWSYLTAPARKIADVLMPEADHVIPYHLLMEGACFARLLDGGFVELAAGDLLMFPAGDRHVLATASDASPPPRLGPMGSNILQPESFSSNPDPNIRFRENILILHDAFNQTGLMTAYQAGNPTLCASCHYSKALDLAGTGPVGPQLNHLYLSRAMHKHHGIAWPLMDGALVPAATAMFSVRPWIENFVDNVMAAWEYGWQSLYIRARVELVLTTIRPSRKCGSRCRGTGRAARRPRACAQSRESLRRS